MAIDTENQESTLIRIDRPRSSAGEAGPSNGDTLPDVFTEPQWEILVESLGLSRRQYQIARGLCRAMSNDEIAWSLRISSSTVHMHMKILFKKLVVHDRIGVVIRLVIANRELSSGGGRDVSSDDGTAGATRLGRVNGDGSESPRMGDNGSARTIGSKTKQLVGNGTARKGGSGAPNHDTVVGLSKKGRPGSNGKHPIPDPARNLPE